MNEIKVLIADDQPLMSQAFRVFIEAAPGMTCVGEVRNGRLAVSHCDLLRPHVVLMDMQMPEMNGVEATRRISEKHPEIRVLAVTTFSSEEYLVPALKAGAAGYLLKDSEPDDIIRAIRSVNEGEAVLSPSVSNELIQSIRQEEPAAHAVDEALQAQLSERELEVLRLLARGMNNSEIAGALYVSEATVKAHLGRIMVKLGVRDRVQTVIKAAQSGLVHLSLG